jgi:hypothetical protein
MYHTCPTKMRFLSAGGADGAEVLREIRDAEQDEKHTFLG